jgi:hypothetical protein
VGEQSKGGSTLLIPFLGAINWIRWMKFSVILYASISFLVAKTPLPLFINPNSSNTENNGRFCVL